jgi:cytochrome c oxidase cbb3-type subunit 3
MESAGRIYEQNCAACHGPTGAGQAANFPNIIDNVWQWGGMPDQVEQTLRAGRQAVMPGLAAVLDEATIADIAQHVIAMQDGADVPAGDSGQTSYATYCSACHGADGTGNTLLGAPNIVDDVTVYGDSEEAIVATIANGRFGIMPPFAGRLDDTQIHMLVAWLTRGGEL